MIKINNNVDTEYPDYLRDESRRTGKAESISFPATQDEVIEAIVYCCENGLKITVQGARTGITAGAVPDGGHIINLSYLAKIGEIRKVSDIEAYLTVESGALLADVNKSVKELSGGRFVFPPDPTETSAAIGGMISCNASGARSFLYGATRNYVSRLKIAMASGSVIEIRRGDEKADGFDFRVEDNNGNIISGLLPEYKMPDVKNAAGYYICKDMDLIDLFIGAEGSLGIILEADLRLIPAPQVVWGIQAFFPSMESSLAFVEKLRAVKTELGNCKLAAIEFIDSNALLMLRAQKDNPAFSGLPQLADGWNSAVYIEFHGENEDCVEGGVLIMSEIMLECGGDEDATWMAADIHELEKLKLFRHAVPEVVNLTIDNRRKKEPGLTKLGTDLAVPDEELCGIIEMYVRDLRNAQLDYVIFGHIGNNHLHVNIIPENMDEYAAGKVLYRKWAVQVVELGGTVSAEHGIGKLKKEMLMIMFGDETLDAMRQVKCLFDPDEIINTGNLFYMYQDSEDQGK
jgi:D-lactate dehydrogenase (cytochrome)